MDFDEKYLDELLKSIEPITGPSEEEEAVLDDSHPDMPEEELESDIAEVLEDEPEPEPEPEVSSEPEPAPAEAPAGVLDVDPADGNKT